MDHQLLVCISENVEFFGTKCKCFFFSFTLKGYQSPNPHQFVNQYNNVSFAPPPHMMQQQPQRIMSPPSQHQGGGARVIPVQIDGNGYKGPVSQSPTVMQK